ncbi:L,D-transpeptidase family protein [Thioclava sp. FR2]|uniref:L,D-transpeptidase family protein n=1 Tax=Thioclava sp. FR2 TaxID=3445780 RepID=UPI003EBEB428
MMRLARLVWLLLLAALFGAALFFLRPIEPPVPPDSPLHGQIERIVVEKAARRLTVWQDGKVVRNWPIALGFAPEGDKVRQGDGKTPEGTFRIDRRNDRSAFHLSLGLDYPQPADRARAKAGGYSPGGDIMIHGQPNSVPEDMKVRGDWTAGCIALTNAQIRELWQVARLGTVVEVRP